MAWRGKDNGELLGLMLEAGLQAIITGDKNMPHQQNWVTYPLPVILLDAAGDQYDDYNALMPQVKELLGRPKLAGGVHVIRPK